MSDFTAKRKKKCPCCGRWFLAEEGSDCSCWECRGCGGWFDDLGDCANKERWLCVYCEDARLQEEVHDETMVN